MDKTAPNHMSLAATKSSPQRRSSRRINHAGTLIIRATMAIFRAMAARVGASPRRRDGPAKKVAPTTAPVMAGPTTAPLSPPKIHENSREAFARTSSMRAFAAMASDATFCQAPISNRLVFASSDTANSATRAWRWQRPDLCSSEIRHRSVAPYSSSLFTSMAAALSMALIFTRHSATPHTARRDSAAMAAVAAASAPPACITNAEVSSTTGEPPLPAARQNIIAMAVNGRAGAPRGQEHSGTCAAPTVACAGGCRSRRIGGCRGNSRTRP
mmetsp:Transcript_45189/g.131486  ORF Transcript_45189/g.131486 Transcript_45189/m.131486 type:complete len:271 (+) Transcript_45189:704-1516(+)